MFLGFRVEVLETLFAPGLELADLVILLVFVGLEGSRQISLDVVDFQIHGNRAKVRSTGPSGDP